MITLAPYRALRQALPDRAMRMAVLRAVPVVGALVHQRNGRWEINSVAFTAALMNLNWRD
jgi:hypothetical protein